MKNFAIRASESFSLFNSRVFCVTFCLSKSFTSLRFCKNLGIDFTLCLRDSGIYGFLEARRVCSFINGSRSFSQSKEIIGADW
jgi:hypothetical protein